MQSRRRWSDVPVPARAVGFTVVAVLAYGTAVHAVQLATGGADPYPGIPRWLAAFYVALVVHDPLAAVLLLRRNRIGIVVAIAVLVTDAAANAHANFILAPGPEFSVGRAAVVVVAGLALALIATLPWVWPDRPR